MASKKVTTTTTTISQDQRVAASGPVGTLLSPGSSLAIGGGGSITAAPSSVVSQHIESVGLQGDAVKGILDSLALDRAAERAAFSNIADDLSGALAAQGQQVTEALTATRTPETSTFKLLVPIVIVIAIVAFLK